MSGITSPVEEIKSRIKIQDLIGETLTVVGRGRTLTTKEHDSLKIFTNSGTWHQFSSGEGGDIFDWYQRAHKCDFRQALEELAIKAGVELRKLSDAERQAAVEERAERARRRDILEIAANYYQMQLWRHPEAVLYGASRGWTEETMRRERIGYSPTLTLPEEGTVTGQTGVDSSGDNNALSDERPLPNPPLEGRESSRDITTLAGRLRAAGVLEHALSKAVLSVPAGMLVYVHQEHGQIVYLSGRSIEGKRHYNLPEEFAEGKQPYANTPAPGGRGVRVLVEGQADAISLGQYGIEAVALCGVEGNVKDISHVAFDNDKAGRNKAMNVALGVDPLCRVVTWPGTLRSAQAGANHVQVKDANDLLKSDATVDDVVKMLEESPTALEGLATVVVKTKGDERKDMLNRFFSIYTGLDEMVQADVMQDLSNHLCGGKISQFKRLLKAYEEEASKEEKKDEYSERHVISPGGYVDGWLFEQCVEKLANGEWNTYYWVRKPDGSFAKMKSVIVGSTAYWPVDARDEDLITGEDVLFASDREESGSEQELLRSIRLFIHRWLDVPTYYENIASYYVLLSWFYDAGYETLPYLRALGEYGTGKTRFIMTIGYICFRPMVFGGGDSDATFYYTMEKFHGTFIADESDFKDSNEAALVAKIINMGNQRRGSIKRMVPSPDNSEYKVKRFSVFGPKIFGARNGFGDQASDSRCLTHYTTAMQMRDDIPRDLTPEFYAAAAHLRNRLLDFRMKHWKPVSVDPNDFDRTIMPRLAQITIGLKSIIHDPDVLLELERFVRMYNQTLMNDRQSSDPAVVVDALVSIRYPKPAMVEIEPDWSISNIAAVAQEIANSLDPDLKFTPKKTGYILSKQLGLFKRGDRASDGKTTLEMEESELEGLMKRYGISKPKHYQNG